MRDGFQTMNWSVSRYAISLVAKAIAITIEANVAETAVELMAIANELSVTTPVTAWGSVEDDIDGSPLQTRLCLLLFTWTVAIKERTLWPAARKSPAIPVATGLTFIKADGRYVAEESREVIETSSTALPSSKVVSLVNIIKEGVVAGFWKKRSKMSLVRDEIYATANI